MSHTTEFVGEDQARKLAAEHLQHFLSQCQCQSPEQRAEAITQLVTISASHIGACQVALFIVFDHDPEQRFH